MCLSIKIIFMRRGFFSSLFTIVIVVITFVSCNSNSENTTTTTNESATTGKDTALPSHMPDSLNVTMQQHAEAVLSSVYPDTSVTGTIKFDADSAGKVTMSLELNIPAKARKTIAVHIHEHGDCADTAKAAHGHWNPTNAQHGKWGSSNFHYGDIGNVKLDSKGKGTLSLTTDLWSLGGTPAKNILGKSIIVHGGVDDYKSQPAGNSGARIGCGVIR